MASSAIISKVKHTSSSHVLLPPRTQNYIRKGLKLGEQLCCHPYVWDDAKGYPVYTKSRLQILGWIVNIAVTVAYFIFLVVQCVRVNSSAEEHASTKALLWFSVILFSFPVFVHATYLMAGEQLSDYVRSYFSYCSKFEGNYVEESARPSMSAKIGGMLLTSVFYSMILDAILITAYGATHLNSPEQLSSIFLGCSLVQVPVCILFCTYFYSTYAAHAFVSVFTPFGALFAFFDVMAELGKGESNFTTEAFRSPENRVRAYRAIQLHADATERVYWINTAAGKYILMQLVMFGAYGAIRFDGLVGLALGMVGASTAVILVVFLSAWAEFHSGSCGAMEALNTMTIRPDVLANGKERAWLRKSVRSLRVAKLSILGMYYVDKELVLGAVGVISDGIFFLLVTF